eukprot:TRINITY_DN9410_c0_g1_i11.p2 TRINITY_DN9410_c0_g1~~TRINITY_DN9410_c0_g1_i11.p2  ORF type:complete len:130 (-),score=3.88 TRINITY_DN9410_c0_g1_i11:69-458(-)
MRCGNFYLPLAPPAVQFKNITIKTQLLDKQQKKEEKKKNFQCSCVFVSSFGSPGGFSIGQHTCMHNLVIFQQVRNFLFQKRLNKQGDAQPENYGSIKQEASSKAQDVIYKLVWFDYHIIDEIRAKLGVG